MITSLTNPQPITQPADSVQTAPLVAYFKEFPYSDEVVKIPPPPPAQQQLTDLGTSSASTATGTDDKSSGFGASPDTEGGEAARLVRNQIAFGISVSNVQLRTALGEAA